LNELALNENQLLQPREIDTAGNLQKLWAMDTELIQSMKVLYE
jgi:hypothetical protein